MGIRHEQAMERTELLNLLGGTTTTAGVGGTNDFMDAFPRCTLDVVSGE